MLLVADVGNTDTVFGLFETPEAGGAPRVWRVATAPRRTAEDWAAFLRERLAADAHEPRAVNALVVGSVVPEVTRALSGAAESLLGGPAVAVAGDSDLGLTMRVDAPAAVGPDRVVNCLAALARWKAPLVVVDFGTATTLDVVDASGAFAGGLIVAGPATLLASLASRTAKLPALPVARPERVIGRNTAEAMQSAAYWGSADLVDGLVARIATELGAKPTVIATGGWSSVIAPACRSIDHTDPDLTLHGLRLAASRLAGTSRSAR